MVLGKTILTEDPRGCVDQFPATAGQLNALQRCQKVQHIWLRRSLSTVYPDIMGTLLVPKEPELVADARRHGSADGAREYFEDGMRNVFASLRSGTLGDAPATIYYAFKQTESEEPSTSEVVENPDRSSTGWQTFLQGLVEAGWSIHGTWPMRTELGNRMRGSGSNALASSIVLVCRPRPGHAAVATRKDFISALRRELPDSLRNLQRGNIAPVDLAQAAIGPGMAVFTRFAKVLESDGSPMTVRTALGLINQTLDEVLAEQEGEFDGDTRWALSWFEQFGVDEGPFGDTETLSKAKNTAISGLRDAGVIVAKAGKVRLVRREELPGTWSPVSDTRLTVWEVTQHLIRRLDLQGEVGAAELVAQLGEIAGVARDLAYRLYSTCERKKWAQEALAYNSLVVAWPELTKLARTVKQRRVETQKEMF
jgi:putative DNA methylase